jgi:DNA-binding HxlR family transcriptional regulator
MSSEKPLMELIESLGHSFGDILNIVKAIGNEKRLQILIALLTGAKSFDTLKKETALKKTALSNHLKILLRQGLIKKPEHGKYQPTHDGDLFIRTIEYAYTKSNSWKKNQTKSLQTRQFSDPFIEALFAGKRSFT